MRSSAIIGALLGVGVAAIPLENRAVKVVEVLDVVTVTLKPGQSAPTQAAKAAPAPAVHTTAAAAAAPAPASNNNGGGFLESTSAAAAPAPAPTSTVSTSGLTSEQASMLETVNYWRRAYQLDELTWDHSMDSNVAEVGSSNDGVNEVHTLISGDTMGQCITPGQQVMFPANAAPGYTPFDIAYLAWLCEVDTDPQLQPGANNGTNVCDLMQGILHMEYGGDTAHHAILVSSEWNAVSCGFTANPNSNTASTYQGIYTCDYRKLP